MFDRIISWSLHNRGVVLLLYVVAAGAALVGLSRMPVDVFPHFAPPRVQIQTEAPGFISKDVELLVTRPLEAALRGMPNVERIRSSSSVGLSRITLVFAADVDVYRARALTLGRLQSARARLPAGVQPPKLMPVTSAVSWLLKFALVDWSGKDRAYELRSLADWEFRNRLLAQDGVASVVNIGGEVKQYQVRVDPLALMRLGISFTQVVIAARDSNVAAPAAFLFPTTEEEYFLRVAGRAHSLAQIRDSALGSLSGAGLTIGDVAQVGFGGKIKRGDAQMYGGPAVISTVSMLWGADTMATTQRVEQTLRALGKTLPDGVEMTPVFRQATFIENSIANLETALFHAVLIVALVLFLFLLRWRPTLISLVAIPTSMMIGILVLWIAGIGLNAMTLGGLIFAIGEVVDDSVIDTENILRRLRENRQSENPQSALAIVYEGSREIRNSIIFATLIIVLAFLPVFFLTGVEGRVFAPLAIAYLAAIGGSLLVALTIVPVLCYYLMAQKPSERTYRMGLVSRYVQRGYRAALRRTLGYPRTLFICGLIVALFTVGLALSLGHSFLPTFHEGNIVIAMVLKPGTSLQENLRVGRKVMAEISTIPEVATVAQRAGRSRLDEDAQPVNFSEFDVTLESDATDVAAIMEQMRARLESIPGAVFNVSQFITHRMQEIFTGVRAEATVKVFGPDLGVLGELQQQVLAAVQGVAGVVDLQVEPMVQVPGIDLEVSRDIAAAYDLTPGAIARQAGQALNGVVVSQVLEGNRAYDLYVRVAADARDHFAALKRLPLQTPAGAVVPLSAVAQLHPTRAPYMIKRVGGARRAIVYWNVAGRDLGAVAHEVRERIDGAITLPPGYSLEFGGDYVHQQRATHNLLWAGAAAVVLMLAVMIYAFRRLPLVALVLLNLPFALAGGIFALFIVGETLSVPALVGLIVLFGIATRNSILLVSRYEQMAGGAGGDSPEAVALHGAMDRVLPILMTALTTALAVIPFLIGDPTGKELQRPLAIVLLGGMVSSTVLNLFLLPAGFAWALRRWPDLVDD
ncbi:MAG: efflux RND transporter permease subunit [Sinobacteraceae bacterium]|nr:efflux RND transporter permease subunit [Nevskiaceae bacterium]